MIVITFKREFKSEQRHIYNNILHNIFSSLLILSNLLLFFIIGSNFIRILYENKLVSYIVDYNSLICSNIIVQKSKVHSTSCDI